jgi:hydroxymethylpyrimidine/phosphomethylpyrimidine kinase
MKIPKALTIAGSDSGGGAGVQADLKTFSAFRVFGMSVLTAVTAQNSMGVHGVETLPPEFVAKQLESVLSDFGADAAKTGMLSTAAIITAVAATLREHRVEKLVVDPVMIAKSGAPLLRPDARETLIRELLPLALVVTPNLHEASVLAEIPVTSRGEVEEAARIVHRLGPRFVLVKGGHLKGEALDLLFDGRSFIPFSAPRIDVDAHGTGCTFSAAITAALANGVALPQAVARAKAYVTATIREAFAAGRGARALKHFIEEW